MPASCLVKCALVMVALFSITSVLGRPRDPDAIWFPEEDERDSSQPVDLPTRDKGSPNPTPMESSAATYTGSQTVIGADGSMQKNTFGASQGANIAADGSKGQLSAANTQQQTFQSGDKLQSQNQGQSQSTSFDKDHQALSNVNTNTNVIRDGQNVREQTSGGAASSLQTAQGSQTSLAQTNIESFKEAGKQGDRTTGSAQSQNIGMDGSASTSNANTGSERILRPDGTVITKTVSSSHTFQVIGNTKVTTSAKSVSSSVGG